MCAPFHLAVVVMFMPPHSASRYHGYLPPGAMLRFDQFITCHFSGQQARDNFVRINTHNRDAGLGIDTSIHASSSCPRSQNSVIHLPKC